jgi:hypothetical protein
LQEEERATFCFLQAFPPMETITIISTHRALAQELERNPTEDILQEEERATFCFLQALPSMEKKIIFTKA